VRADLRRRRRPRLRDATASVVSPWLVGLSPVMQDSSYSSSAQSAGLLLVSTASAAPSRGAIVQRRRTAPSRCAKRDRRAAALSIGANAGLTVGERDSIDVEQRGAALPERARTRTGLESRHGTR
jgi:hypothetical protein